MIRTFPFAVLLAVTLSACGDDPFRFQWSENPREASLFSLDRQELNRPSAFDMLQGRRVVIEHPGAAGRWDFALDRGGDGFVFLPPRTLGVTSRAAMVPLPGISFEDLREAPADTALYVSRAPVPVVEGRVYAVRTHEQPDPFGRTCVFYGKLEVLEPDFEAGTLSFRFDTSPDCNNRSLVPPGS